MSSQRKPLLPTNAPRAPAAKAAVESTTNIYSNVIYKGSTGQLTIAPDYFLFEEDDGDGSSSSPNMQPPLKCRWTRVVTRHTSPPHAPQAVLQLGLVSGRTVVFGVPNLPELVRLIKDVRQKMDAVAEQKANHNNNNNNYNDIINNNNMIAPSAVKDAPETPEPQQQLPDDDEPDDYYQDEHNEDSHDRNDESHDSWKSCCWEDLWFILCMVMTFFVVILGMGIVYVTVLRDDRNSKTSNNANNRALPPCVNEDGTIVACPPDYGLEAQYGIRAVEYEWTASEVRLQYFVSDYIILEDSVQYTIWDNSNGRKAAFSADDDDPRKTGQAIIIMPSNNNTNNKWFQVDLVEYTAVDGGTNLFNKGQGTRQFDITIGLLPELSSTDLAAAPFYVPRGVTGEKGWLRVCVDVSIAYNRVDGLFDRRVEVNYIETALQLSVDAQRPTEYEDVQVRTVTTPDYT